MVRQAHHDNSEPAEGLLVLSIKASLHNVLASVGWPHSYDEYCSSRPGKAV